MEFRSDVHRQHNTLDLIIEDADVHDKVFVFDKLLKSTLEKHTPLLTVKIKNRPCAFVPNEIKNMMKSRDHLHQIFLNTRRQADWMAFVTARDQVKAALSHAEKDYYTSEICIPYGILFIIVFHRRTETR